jgi:hypothetical protein
VLDYIFIKGKGLQTRDVKLGGNEPVGDDETLYPSDHFAIVGQF